MDTEMEHEMKAGLIDENQRDCVEIMIISCS